MYAAIFKSAKRESTKVGGSKTPDIFSTRAMQVFAVNIFTTFVFFRGDFLMRDAWYIITTTQYKDIFRETEYIRYLF